MFTKEEYDFLIRVLNAVPLQGNLPQLREVMVLMTSILSKLEALKPEEKKDE